MAQGARDPGLRGARRLGRVRAPRRAGADRDRVARPPGGAAVHPRDGRALRRRGDGLPHRLHGRGGRRADVPRGGRGRRCGTRSSRTATTPCGLGARDTLRLEVCYPLHGNDITDRTRTRSRPGSAGRARSTRSSPASPSCAGSRRRGRQRRLVAFVMDEKAVPRQGMPIDGGGEVTSGTHSPMLDRRHRDGIRPGRRRRRRTRSSSSTSAAGRSARTSSRSRSTSRRSELVAGSESYPEDLKYHPEHDWARDRGRRGRARDHVVGAGRARRARPLRGSGGRRDSTVKDEAYGEVESVKAVSDVIAPLSGEILEVNEKAVDEPETVNDDPYGEGWLVRIRLGDPAEVDALLDVEAYRARRSRAMTAGYLSLTDRDREEMLAAIGVSSIDELFAQIPDGVRFDRRAGGAAGAARAGARPRTSRSSRRRTRTPASSSRSSARASTTTTCRRSSTRSSGAASSSPRTRRTSRR